MPDAKPAANDSQTPAASKPAESEKGSSLLGSQPTPAPEGEKQAAEGATQKPDAAKEAPKDGTKPAEKGEEKIAIKFPEGVQPDQGQLDEFVSVAKELGLKSDGAQKMIDLFVKTQQAQKQEIDKQIETWTKEITSVPGHEKLLANAKKAMAKAFDQDTQTLLSTTWIGSHPGLIRGLAKLGELIAEDKLLEGGAGKKEFEAKNFFEKSKMN